MSQSDTWLLIYGREKANQVVALKATLIFLSSKFPKKFFWRRIKIFANYFVGLAVLFIHKRTAHFLSVKECGETFETMPESFLSDCF